MALATTAIDPRRVARALAQRLQLQGLRAHTASQHTYEVLGTSDTAYEVTLDTAARMAACTCPDHVQRRSVCKHVLYVLFRILRGDATASTLGGVLDSLQLQPARCVPATCQSPVLLRVAGAHPEWAAPRWEAGDECALCFDELRPDREYIYWCRRQCGKCIHRTCAAGLRGNTCPFCRAAWQV